MALVVEGVDGGMDGAVEMVEITKGLMGEEMPLEVAPEMFDGIELGGVLRQPFDAEPGPDALVCKMALMDKYINHPMQ